MLGCDVAVFEFGLFRSERDRIRGGSGSGQEVSAMKFVVFDVVVLVRGLPYVVFLGF